MNTLRTAPLFVIACPFVAGLALAPTAGFALLVSGIIALLIAAFCLRADRSLLSRCYERLMQVFLLLAAAGAGAATGMSMRNEKSHSIEAFNCHRITLSGVIAGAPRDYGKGPRADLRVDTVWAMGQAWPLRAKVRLYAPTGTVLRKFDRVEAEVQLSNLPAVSESYFKRMARKGIRHAAYCSELHIRGAEQGILAAAHRLQTHLAQNLRQIVPGARRAALGAALMVGEVQDMDDEVRADFAASGLSHVISISGMHIGIIAAFLGLLLMPLQSLPQGWRLRHIILIICMLAYMLICGAGPAVMRATLMFALGSLIRLFRKQYVILNLLGGSALLQLALFPNDLYNVGFQLSYTAVAGIALGMPLFERWFYTQRRMVDTVIACVGVTISATVFTAPLIWLHFGQFPVHFLIANILAAALASVMVVLGFLAVVLSEMPGLNALLGKAFSFLLGLLEALSSAVAELPHALLTRLSWREPGIYWILLETGFVLLLIAAPRLWTQFWTQRILSRRPAAPRPLVAG